MPETTATSLDPALPAPPWARRSPAWRWALLFVVALWALRAGALVFTDGPGGLALVWPATGLLAYALLVCRRRSWPLLAFVATAGGIGDSLRVGRPPSQAVALNVATSLAAVGTAWLVVRLTGRPTLRTLRGAVAFVLAPAAAVGAISLVSRAALGALGAAFAEHRFWVFWGGSTLGIVLLTPLLVEWSEPAPARAGGARAALAIGAIAAAGGAGLALLRVPGFPPTGHVVLLLPLLWAALQFGQRGATTALAIAGPAYLAAGPGAGDAPAGPCSIQLFLGLGAVSILAVAAVGEERRAAEERRALLESAMDHSPDPAGIIAEDGRVVWANDAAARTLGVTRAALVGHSVLELGPTPERWREVWARAAAGRAVIPAPRGLGVIEHGEISAGLVDVGGARLLVAVLHDLTDRHRAEEASRLAALGTLAAGVAHEINNPLSCVVSNLGYLAGRLSTLPDRDGRLAADVLEPLAEAEEGARRVRDIVRQLGTFDRPDEGSALVDPARPLRTALAMAANEVRHRARLVSDIAVTPPVVASERGLGQVFLSLLVNAAQAIPDGSADRHEVRVALASRGDRVVLEVADSGRGMSEATRSRIFEPFFTTREPGAGSGLGLSIAHAIVTRLGGHIDVESAPGRGSSFRVSLPAARGVAGPAPAQRTPPPRSRGEPPAARRLRVLVVDDEPLVSRALARLLGRHEVVAARDGRDALRRLRAGERFDAVVCDLMMPELSGMELHAAVAEVDPGLAERFVFVTGGAFTDSAREFLSRTPNPRLEKPVDRSALDAALREVAQA